MGSALSIWWMNTGLVGEGSLFLVTSWGAEEEKSEARARSGSVRNGMASEKAQSSQPESFVQMMGKM